MRISILVALLVSGCAAGAGGPGPETPEGPARPPEVLREGRATGVLDACDPRDEDGRYFDDYVVTLAEGDRVRFWVASGGIDGMLRVTGPGEVDLRNDDFAPGSLNPLIELQAPEAGRYTVRAIAFAPGQSGAYEIGMTRLDPSAGPRLSLGAPLEAMASPGGAGEGMQSGASYWVELRSGQRVRFRVTSPQFDTTAALIAPSGQSWVNDDAHDSGPDGTERPLDSTVTMVAPVAGMYHLLVAPFGGRGGGAFRVRTTAREPVILPEGQSVPTVGFAGREGDGRLLGLFAGITDYGEGHSDLYGCADDATLLARAFRERGLMGEAQQTVLTDIDANLAAFRAGLHRLAEQSTAQDVVVIFYSGHGGTESTPSEDPRELDGADENIVLYDGNLLDDEVVSLIDGITADVIILALDACHSGGFARDFLTRPNRIGLFSSDEDVLSDTAEPLLAGGYLSYALRHAVLGHADAMPADGALFAGELTDYLNRTFAEHVRRMNPEGSHSPMQWLVHRRGGVSWSDIIWLYPRGPDGELRPTPDVTLDSPPPRRRGSGETPPRPTTCP